MMRNNTKIKLLLRENDLLLSMTNGEMDLIVTDKERSISFIVSGKNLSDILSKAFKHLPKKLP